MLVSFIVIRGMFSVLPSSNLSATRHCHLKDGPALPRKPPSPFYQHVGQRMRMVRKQRDNLPMSVVADVAGVTEKHMSRLELGQYRVTLEQLYYVARGHALPISYFLQDVPEDPEELERQRVILKSDPRNWKPGASDEEEAALLALWRALESEEQKGHLLGLLESLVFEKGKGRGR